MADETPITLDEIHRLDVRSGDVLFVSVKRRIHPDVAEAIRANFKTALPDDVKVFVGDEGTSVSVIRREAE